MQDTAPTENRQDTARDLAEESTILRATFAERHGALVRRRDDLLQAVDRVPATVEDEQTAGDVGDFIKQLDAGRKAAEGARVAEKEPFLEGGRTVDGWFKKITEPLAKAKTEIEGRLNIYLGKKAAAARKAREEVERKAREEAVRLAADAALLEENAKDATTLDNAVAAEEAAKVAAKTAAKAQQEATAKPADLSRIRGDYGAVASLRTHWTFDDLDRPALDLESLRQHLSTDALEKAIRSFIKAGGHELDGVRIFETTSTVVR